MNQCWVTTVERLAELDRQQSFQQLAEALPSLLPRQGIHAAGSGLVGLKPAFRNRCEPVLKPGNVLSQQGPRRQ